MFLQYLTCRGVICATYISIEHTFCHGPCLRTVSSLKRQHNTEIKEMSPEVRLHEFIEVNAYFVTLENLLKPSVLQFFHLYFF